MKQWRQRILLPGVLAGSSDASLGRNDRVRLTPATRSVAPRMTRTTYHRTLSLSPFNISAAHRKRVSEPATFSTA